MKLRWLAASAVLLLCLTTLATAQTGPPPAAEATTPVSVVDLSQASPAQRLLAASLQGIVNRRGGTPRIFLLTNARDREWLQYCLRVTPRPTQTVTPDQLLESVKAELKGQILYDPNEPYTINVATTAAGVRGAVVTAEDLGLPTILDLRHRWKSAAEAYAWAESSLLPECSRNQSAIMPAEATAARDYAIQGRMFVFGAPDSPGEAWFRRILMRLAPGTAVYGEEPAAVLPAISESSHFFVPAAQAANLSFFSQLDTGHPFYQYFGFVDGSAARYLAIILDCSDVGFAINDMPALWERSTRGSVSLGWALPAALAEVAPPVVHRYYADAYRSGIDGFVLGPNGAGEMDLTGAGAPFTFFRATAKAKETLDAHAVLLTPPASLTDLGPAVQQLVTETAIRGAFVLGPPDFDPLLFGGTPVVAAPRVDSVQAAIAYLDRIPLERRFAALCLDPRSLTPADAAHIAAHVSRRYAVVTPEQLLDLMRSPAAPSQPGQASAAVESVQYPDPSDPNAPVPVKANVVAQSPPLSAIVVYRTQFSPRPFYEVMDRTTDGYQANLPPLRSGGEIDMSVMVTDAAGRTAWSPAWKVQAPRVDTDQDGLSDAEEALLLTDPKSPDTDGDGLMDGADATPLRFDEIMVNYFGPIFPPSDLPYLPEPGTTTVGAAGRHIRPGQSCLYWLPLHLVPAQAPSVVGLSAAGPAKLEVSGDGVNFTQEFAGTLDGEWYSRALPPPHPGGAFLRLTCPADGGELVVAAAGAFSPPGAPSVTGVVFFPAHPGPGQPIAVSAVAYSPKKIAQVSLGYRVSGGGEITIPMQQIGGSQRYQASLPAMENRDELEWWITARDGEGSEAATLPEFLPIGSRSRETVSLLGIREFVGEWQASSDWAGAGRQALAPGLTDSAAVNLTGGLYSIWVLAGGRGQGIGAYIGDKRVGAIDPDKPDGWQEAGRVRLDAGRQQVHLVSEAGSRAPDGSTPRYAAVILTADSTFRPPNDRVLDIYNALVMLSPRPGDTISGRVDLLATGAGNVTAVDFALDGQVLRHVNGPPFTYSLGTERIPNGPHVLKVTGFDRAGGTGLELQIPVSVANGG